MADLEKLTMEVETTAGDSEGALRTVTRRLRAMNKALKEIDSSKLKDASAALKGLGESANTSGIKRAANDIKKATGDIKKGLSGTDKLKTAFDFGKGFASGTWKNAKTVIGGVTGSMKVLNNAFGLGHITSGKFISSLARIAGYRFVRTIISSVTSGAAKGLENLAHASSEANATLSQLSGGALTLQNAMGGALYSAIASIIGLLSSVISAAVTAINWISMLFAILGGRGTFKKATSATKEYAGALGGAAGGAKALKQELMGFDEINSLSPDTGGGGGGGGGGMLDYGSMFEEAPVSQSLKEMVEKADFTALGESLATKINTALGNVDWSRIQTGAYKLANSLVTFINGFVGKIDERIIGDTIAGLINTGITFVNRLGYGIGWRLIGLKIKWALMRAISQINPEDVGPAFTVKIDAIVETLRGAIPTTAEEWSEITKWVADCVNASIDAIDADTIGSIAGDIITGALEGIISFGEAGTLTNLTSKIAEAIKTAISEVDEEQLKTALKTLLKDAWEALKVVFDLVVEIGDTTVGKALTAFGLYRVLAPAMSALGIKGYSSSVRGMALAGAVSMFFDMVASVQDVKAGVENGSGISKEQIADIVGDALTSIGLTLIGTGTVSGGVVTAGVGLALKFVASTEFEWLMSNVAQTFTGIIGGASVEALGALEEATDGVVLTQEELANVSRITAGILEDGISVVDLGFLSAGFANGTISAAEYQAILEGLGITAESVTEGVTGLIDAMSDAGNVDASGATEAVKEVEAAVEEATAAIDSMPLAIDTPKIDAAAMSTTNATLQATGEQAEALKTKIIEIPSDIVFNLTLNNYESVMTSLDTLKSTAGEVATGMSDSFTGINWFGIGSRIAEAFKRGIKSVKMPKMSVSWSTSSKTASILGKSMTISIPTPTIKMYAKGGFPDAGELFMANENGRQEMIGRIGSKPAVANQDQIGDAIFKYMDAHEQESGGMDYNAMANALVGAMKSAGLGALYLDGKQIKDSLNRESRRSGKPILT